MKSPIALLQTLLLDVGSLQPDVKGLDRDYHTIEARVKHEGNSFLSITLPTLGDALMSGIESGKFACPTAFSRRKEEALPKLLWGLLCKVFDIRTGVLLDNPSEESILSVWQITRMFKKLLSSNGNESKLGTKAIKEFFDTDRSLSTFNFDRRKLDCIKRASYHILRDLISFKSEDIVCKHGPGAVCERLLPNSKWALVDLGILNYQGLSERYGYDSFASLDWKFRASTSYHLHAFHLASHTYASEAARLVTVPKNSTSRRLITVEPCLNQFIQQGLNIALRDSISNCDVLSQCLALTDQSKNQQLALEGSRDGTWSTLDLSSASDLLSTKVVEAVFGSKISFYGDLLRSRSSQVMHGNTLHNIEKYAGAGNATTFPVQSVAFALIGLCAILEHRCENISKGSLQRIASYIRCYGDDIIVRTEYTSQVVTWLTDVGLKINVRKSFSNGKFRESCGVDAYNGVDITPVYVKRLPDNKSRIEPSVLSNMVSASNSFWNKCYYRTGDYLKELSEASYRKKLPLVSLSSSSLGWHTRLNAYTIEKWNKVLHRFEYRGVRVKSVKLDDPLDGYAALLKFFHTPLLGRGDGHLSKVEVKRKTRLTNGWVASL